uniref:PAX-interacting protein 1 n=1 Tax=Culex pipiens TaxID=7175 RepID=A0A8D8J950_CULPI
MNPRLSQDMLALQQQQQQQQQQVVGPMQQQRRTLGNITNSGAPAGAMVVQQIPQGPPVVMPQSPSTMKGAGAGPPFSPGRAPLPRSQFYGHNPNLKLHPELFLLGCTFYIIEYDESPFKNDVEDWKTIIRKHGGDIEQCYSPKVTHVLCRTQRHGVVMQAIRDAKRCITSYWLNDIVLKKQLLPPWQALHLPTPSIFGNQKPATKHNMSLTGFEGEERVRIKQMIEESGAKMTPYFSKSNTVLICKRIDNQKYKFAKDWNVPTVNTVWLSDILLGNLAAMQQCDGPKYQQFNLSCPFRIDYNLVMHLMTAWKSPINLTPESHERVKRSLSEPPQPATPPKKARTLPPLEAIPGEIVCQRQPDADSIPHVLFSQIDNTEGLMRAVMTLGGRIASGPADATHLVMTRVARTVKLITALTTVRYVLSSKWISDSASAGQFLPPDNYRLDVKELDETFRCDLYKVLESPARNKLFEGKIFFITPQVKPSAKDVRQMIELSGGVVEKNPRSVKKIRETNLEKPGSYVIVGCPEDRIFIQPFIQKGKHGACQICTSEYVMQSILQQKLTIEPHVIKWELGS